MNILDEPMGNAELRLTLQEIKEIATATKEQATKTNGKVAEAHLEIERLKQWRTGLSYAYVVFTVFVLPTLALTLYQVWAQPKVTPEQAKEIFKDVVNQYELHKVTNE